MFNPSLRTAHGRDAYRALCRKIVSPPRSGRTPSDTPTDNQKEEHFHACEVDLP
jgi:hypothetical protein